MEGYKCKCSSLWDVLRDVLLRERLSGQAHMRRQKADLATYYSPMSKVASMPDIVQIHLMLHLSSRFGVVFARDAIESLALSIARKLVRFGYRWPHMAPLSMRKTHPERMCSSVETALFTGRGFDVHSNASKRIHVSCLRSLIGCSHVSTTLRLHSCSFQFRDSYVQRLCTSGFEFCFGPRPARVCPSTQIGRLTTCHGQLRLFSTPISRGTFRSLSDIALGILIGKGLSGLPTFHRVMSGNTYRVCIFMRYTERVPAGQP